MLGTQSWWLKVLGVGNTNSTFFKCWCLTLMKKYREFWWQKWPKSHQHISSPISVTNINVTWLFESFQFIVSTKDPNKMNKCKPIYEMAQCWPKLNATGQTEFISIKVLQTLSLPGLSGPPEKFADPWESNTMRWIIPGCCSNHWCEFWCLLQQNWRLSEYSGLELRRKNNQLRADFDWKFSIVQSRKSHPPDMSSIPPWIIVLIFSSQKVKQACLTYALTQMEQAWIGINLENFLISVIFQIVISDKLFPSTFNGWFQNCENIYFISKNWFWSFFISPLSSS